MGFAPHITLGIYLLLLLALGVVSMLKSRKAAHAEEDYYLSSRGQGVLVTSLTIMATYFSGFAILTFPGWVYSDGIAPMLYALNLPVAAMAIYILGNRIRRIGKKRGYITPADMIADYYGESPWIRGLVTLVGALYVIPYVVMQVKAGGILARGLFPEGAPIPLWGMELTIEDAGVGALSLVTMLYVIVGGMRSVAWTDVLQGLLLLSAMLLSGLAIMNALGGPNGYFAEVSKLDGSLLTMPEAPERFNVWQAMTFCLFASLASIVQPAQWMRFYAARSSKTLRQSAIAFGSILPVCFIFGVFLVGLGGRALYPMVDGVLPEGMSKPDDIVIKVIQDQFPAMFGAFGMVLVSLILVAVMAASMSTADSNLHALSAVATRDVYHRARPRSTEKERTWFGRGVIVVATVGAAAISYLGNNSDLLTTLTAFFFLAMAFSAQLLPVTVDLLFVRRGSKAGAMAGMLAGILTVCLFPPLGTLLLGEENVLVGGAGTLKALLDVGFCGIVVNVLMFVVVSRFTRKPDAARREDFRVDLLP
ncbi:MAG: sodium:solute symporter family protein [Verrucomicrobia bacterium]|nr:sodium:solute symporter family protein [Verrucomicrobiota bacterium]MDA1006707.1 sodium:solute symporter family protein [Verrucomicrobiota bacterium]